MDRVEPLLERGNLTLGDPGIRDSGLRARVGRLYSGRRRRDREEFAAHLIERETFGDMRRLLRRDRLRQLFDRLLQVRIVFREGERGAVLHERLGQVALAVEDLGEAANRGEVL